MGSNTQPALKYLDKTTVCFNGLRLQTPSKNFILHNYNYFDCRKGVTEQPIVLPLIHKIGLLNLCDTDPTQRLNQIR